MALVNKPYTFSAGASIVASEHNSNYDTIYNEFNGSISNANISASAAISDSKLAQLATAGKVSGASITLLTSLPSGAGIVPTANLGSGTATSAKYLKGDQTWGAFVATDMPAGTVVQVVNTQTGAVSTGTTAIPLDDTIPQNTEGDEYMTLAITPSSATNKLKIDVVLFGSNNSGANNMAALFQDSTAAALASGISVSNAGGSVECITFTHYMNSGTTSATTFKVRGGGNSGTFTFNGAASARIFGGVMASSITISEIKV